MVSSMKQKRISIIIIITILATLLMGIFSVSNATTATETKYLTIRKLRDSGYGYEARNLNKTVWKIVETNSTGTSDAAEKTIYCIKGGPGFGSSDFGNATPTVAPYTEYFDLKNPSAIPEEYREALPDINSSTYKSLLWLLENIYVPAGENPTSEEEEAATVAREKLLNAAGITNRYLTDDDIDVVQQLAIWHFTNLGGDYDSGEEIMLAINAIKDQDSNYRPISDLGDDEYWDRETDTITLYKYLVNTAEKAAEDYVVTTSRAPYELADLTQTIRESGNNYIIGPFRINQVSDTNGTLQGTFKNGNEETLNPTFQNEDGTVTYNNLQETVGNDFYIVVPNTTNVDKITFSINGIYTETVITYWSVANPDPLKDQPVVIVEKKDTNYNDSVEFIKPSEEIFDLALRKFIISINGVAPTDSRVPQISDDTLSDLENGTTTTADKIHPKNPLTVKTGDSVVYTIRVYNEGNVDGIVTEITDYLPNGLQLKANSSINTENGWTTTDGRTITTDKLSGQVIPAFDGTTLSYLDVQIECEVVAKVSQNDTKLKNIAEITGATNSEGEDVIDRDSTPDNVDVPGYGDKSQEDDDDFEDLIILGQYFDLSLRKFIIQVNDTELKDSSGNYLREPQVDITPLTSGTSTTAIYNHPKDPVEVAVGDEVIYTVRVYNEGQIDGYVHEITDYLPANLEFVNDEFNASYGWKISEDGRTVTTDITSPNTEYSASRDTIYADRKDSADKVILEAFDGTTLDYIDVKIKCRVKSTAIAEEKLTNIAEITDFTDSEGGEVTDRDSVEDNVTLPSDETLPNYKDEEINRGDEYIPGQQDDDDFDKVVIQKFDLSLRKFITGVNDTVINNREPVFSIVDGKYVYTHTKDPVEVETGDVVIYTLRIYNEGDIAGYAEEVKDDVPEGLEFLPDNTTNINYRWVMYDANGEITDNPEEAVTIRTDYLSKAQEDETGRENLIDAFDPETMTQPDYKDLQIAFRVIEPNTSDRILINTAEISEDANEDGEPVEDIDSTPDNDKDGEDDIDIEKVKVTYFDLALKKIISKVTMTLDGETTVEETGHTFEDNPEEVVKIELGNHKINDAVIKFTYQIRITNEGNKAGYAYEIKDYIPEGLEFVEEDNEGWVLSDDGKTVTTTQLSETLLEPGDSAVVEITLRWINGHNNLGIKTNWAEISEDSDDDIDSTPDNFKEGEDDIDDAEVVLSIVTGVAGHYVGVITGVVALLGVGIFLIKRYVL